MRLSESFRLSSTVLPLFLFTELEQVIVLFRRFKRPLKKPLKLPEMFSCRRVNDDGPAFANGFDPSHAKAVALQSSPDLGGTEGDVEVAAVIGRVFADS
jgi:hypothetical protein